MFSSKRLAERFVGRAEGRDLDPSRIVAGAAATTVEGEVLRRELDEQRALLTGEVEILPGETQADAKKRHAKEHGHTYKAEANPLKSVFTAVSSVFTAPMSLLNSAWDKATNLFSGATSAVSKFAENAWDVTTDAASAVGNRLEQGWDFVSSIPGKLGRFAENKFDMFTDTSSDPAPALKIRGPALELN